MCIRDRTQTIIKNKISYGTKTNHQLWMIYRSVTGPAVFYTAERICLTKRDEQKLKSIRSMYDIETVRQEYRS